MENHKGSNENPSVVGESGISDGPDTASAMSKTTTISTIAVQSGKTRIVIALLHVRYLVTRNIYFRYRMTT